MSSVLINFVHKYTLMHIQDIRILNTISIFSSLGVVKIVAKNDVNKYMMNINILLKLDFRTKYMKRAPTDSNRPSTLLNMLA